MGSQPVPAPSWKEEVNRRLAAHKSRKGLCAAKPLANSDGSLAAKRSASEAAARVAARYANVPTYSEMQAAEARAALRAAEVATRAALEAQVVAQAALDNLEKLRPPEEPRRNEGQKSLPVPAAPVSREEEPKHRPALAVLWDSELARVPAVENTKASVRTNGNARKLARDYENDMPLSRARDEYADSVQEVPAVQPIPANLIEFPRELVATRRMRPRLTGNRHDALSEMFGQLSIFEVDPGTVSTEPSQVEPQRDVDDRTWTGPEWSGMQLDEAPETAEAEPAEESKGADVLYLARASLRLLANVVDLSLILGITTGIAALVAHSLESFPGLKTTELAAAAALALAAVLYFGLSFVLAGRTLGMKFAGIALCTFEGESPDPAQIRGRFGAMLISLLPFGLGAAWAIFDDDHLCWHNRTAKMYLRECEREDTVNSIAR